MGLVKLGLHVITVWEKRKEKNQTIHHGLNLEYFQGD